ncbi:hypothetical protein [Azospirillum soli]|uniref:hypothetical protein n=1 Tax=Azospirillum soli TaxID=1304799 RepID=UPI001AE92E9B|nr:hypothetical protein [Azospirillum soli]MBP2311354.1 hypothetical protein [Azospirillum soli]
MLYLRDIEVDVHVRCCACGHEGVLPRARLQRRFGPNYPVLSIAPHYRCSKCDSRDTETRPAPAHLSVVTAAEAEVPAQAPTFAGPLAALQGLLDAVRSRDGEEQGDEKADSREAVQPPPCEPVKPGKHKPAEPAKHKPAEPDDIPLEALIADGPPAPESGRRPLWEPISLADMAARLEADEPPADEGTLPEQAEPATVEEEPLDWTIAALRGMIDAGDKDERTNDEGKEDEEDALPPVFSPKALVRSDFDEDENEDEFDDAAGFGDELPDADEEPSEEEILAFAIRDPEKAPPPWERDRGWEREPDDQPLDKTIAALRNMVQEAAAEPAGAEEDAEDDEPPARPRFAIVDSAFEDDDTKDIGVENIAVGDIAGRADDAPRMRPLTDEAPEPEPDEAPKPRKSAQELEMEEALKALRALVEADDPEEEEHRPLSLAEIVRQKEDPSDRDSKALSPTDIYAPGERAPWDDDATTVDLVDEVKDEEDDEKSAKSAPSPLDKTIAALRGMLELDGKRGR